MIGLLRETSTVERTSEIHRVHLVGYGLLTDYAEALPQHLLCLGFVSSIKEALSQGRKDLITECSDDASSILVKVRPNLICSTPAELCHHQLIHTV